MSAVPRLLVDARALNCSPLQALSQTLVGRGWASIRLVYAVLDGELLATLLASPQRANQQVDGLGPQVSYRLRRAFCHWMALAHPDWRRGQDSGGVLDWDLIEGQFVHRHSSYRWVPSCHRRSLR